MVRVDLGADRLDRRVDLDRVDMTRAPGKGERGVRPAARADDQDVLVGPAREPLVDLVVERLLGAGPVDDRVERLVRDAVDVDVDDPARVGVLADPVVGRPDARRCPPGRR